MDSVRIHCVFRRSKVTLDIQVRPMVLERHRAMAGVLGHSELSEYFDSACEDLTIEEVLTFVVSPYFAGYTAVEFAQELMELALADSVETPWQGEPTDMSADAFRELVGRWAREHSADEEVVYGVSDAALCALRAQGEEVMRCLKPFVLSTRPRVLAEEDGST
jgi:hypothetical protein